MTSRLFHKMNMNNKILASIQHSCSTLNFVKQKRKIKDIR